MTRDMGKPGEWVIRTTNWIAWIVWDNKAVDYQLINLTSVTQRVGKNNRFQLPRKAGRWMDSVDLLTLRVDWPDAEAEIEPAISAKLAELAG